MRRSTLREVYNAGKGRRNGERRRRQPTAKWTDSITEATRALWEDLVDELGTDHLEENLVIKNQHQLDHFWTLLMEIYG